MNAYEKVAVDHYLSDYPNDWDYERILDSIEKEMEEIVVWEPFCWTNRSELIDLIDALRDTLTRTFIARC